MSNRRRKPNVWKRVFYALLLPVRSLAGALGELWGSVTDLGFRIPFFGRGRRNRDFEKAGREPRGKKRRRTSSHVFRKGERDRKRELAEAERENRKYLSGNSKKAIEYREQLEERNVNCSRGETVNYLAQVNAKHRKSNSKKDDSED